MCFSFLDDLEPNSLAVIPGMGIPEQLKLAMEQEQMGKRQIVSEKSIFIYFKGIPLAPSFSLPLSPSMTLK